MAPVLFELNDLDELQREVFGPVLHVVRYAAGALDELIDQINAKGFALTHGIHSRIDSTVAHICRRIEAGNVYVNRNIVGAVVGVQPFGGHGLSGTGPKAGGSFYLQRLSAGAPWQMPPLSKTGEADDAALQTMASLLAQMGFGHDAKVRLAAVLGESRVHTLRQAEMPLPGPTGERNSLSWHAPQRVWLYGGDLETAFAALIRLAASGIRVQVLPVHPLAIWQEHAGQWLEVSETPFAGASHVVALENLPANIKTQLSAQRGALVKVLLMPDGVDVLPLFDEISRSVNTTAAGGNASLMAMAEG